MNNIPFRMTTKTSNSTMTRKKKALVGEHNLFHNQQPRNLPKTSHNATLPVIALSSLSYFKERFIQMGTKNKSVQTSNPMTLDFRLTKIKSHIRGLNRVNIASLPKSPLRHHPTHRSIKRQDNTRCLYADQLPRLSRRTISARTPKHPILPRPPPPPPAPLPAILPQSSHDQYGHFLAYLRRQSLARQRRRQQEDEEGAIDHIETTIRLNLNKQTSSLLFQSSSQHSLASLNTYVSSMPMISMTARRAGRPSFSHRPEQRTMKVYQQTSSPIFKTTLDHLLLTSSSILITPRNSVVDDEIISPIVKPSEFHLNDDSVSDRRPILTIST